MPYGGGLLGGQMPGYTRIDNDVLVDLLKLPGRTTDVYMAILSHRNQKTGLCNPSQETIADECGLYVRTVRRLIAVLIEAGLLVSQPQTNRTGKASNHYYFSTGRGQERPQGRGHNRQGLRSGETSPKDRSGETSKQGRSQQDEDIAYCNKRGHNWGEVDNGSTLYCGRCGQEQPNNVIELQA